MRNEDTSPEATKGIWEQACASFEVLLDDFRRKNLLRTNVKKADREKLNLVWENSRNYEIALRDMLHRFGGKPEDFANKCTDVGLSERTVNCLFVSQLTGTYLIELEAVFRTSLLFFLREDHFKKKWTLTSLLKKIKKVSPSIGAELSSLIDTEWRNCFAHGTFWFQKGGRLFLAKNSHLEGTKEISLGKLWIRCLEMSIVANALVDTIKRKENQGYFKPGSI